MPKQIYGSHDDGGDDPYKFKYSVLSCTLRVTASDTTRLSRSKYREEDMNLKLSG